MTTFPEERTDDRHDGTRGWLAAVTAALEDASGARLDLDGDTASELLDLARVAAHDSGAKLNAPLACFLVGRASALGEASPAQLAEAVRAASAQWLAER
jgi:hypothetical protein